MSYTDRWKLSVSSVMILNRNNNCNPSIFKLKCSIMLLKLKIKALFCILDHKLNRLSCFKCLFSYPFVQMTFTISYSSIQTSPWIALIIKIIHVTPPSAHPRSATARATTKITDGLLFFHPWCDGVVQMPRLAFKPRKQSISSPIWFFCFSFLNLFWLPYWCKQTFFFLFFFLNQQHLAFYCCFLNDKLTWFSDKRKQGHHIKVWNELYSWTICWLRSQKHFSPCL